MVNNIIDYSDPGIVVKENTVHLSDEKLKSVLLRTYERAQQDMSEIKLHKYYGIFLSVASTLFMSLLTSTFNAVGSISAKTVTIIAWIIFAISTGAGFILMAIHVAKKTRNDTDARDKAVSEIFEQNFSKE